MRIYEMTATFGKLEHDTLTLKPGLNIIHAPNEWGKSTWCAFLSAMLYGLDTRAKSTKTALADKERYAPWSGSPMAGRISLNWNDRDITIERSTKGRVPLGEFRAYETKTGLDVPELTAANCGQMLLGVEQSVFRRAGFIRLSDLPVTQDDALRRRLNALVTTGDESGDGERLARDLKELKNRCRYNRTGLLPQAEAERDALEEKLRELDALEVQSKKIKSRLGEVKSWLRELENHQQALAYAAAYADAERVAQARDARDQALRNLESLENACAKLPTREETEKKLRELRGFCEQWNAVQMESQMLPKNPLPPVPPARLEGMSLERGKEMVQEAMAQYAQLSRGKPGLFLLVLGCLCLLGAGAALVLRELLTGGIALAAALVLLTLGIGKKRSVRNLITKLEETYGGADPSQWMSELQAYEEALQDYNAALTAYRDSLGDLDVRMMVLQKRRESLCGAQNPEKVLDIWQQVLAKWDDYYAACRETQQAEHHLKTLQAMAKPVEPPAMADNLTYSGTDTARLISDCETEQQRLQNRLGQYQGRMEALGEGEQLQKQLAQLNERIAKLEDTYAALTIAQETLAEARAELQRRFAPRIAKRAQELLGQMTSGRYDRLLLGADLSLQAGAEEENILHDALWRSDGTVDQLYLALRLAVAEELTPEAPLILDDALVRFDDTRLKAALKILEKEAETKQVILFSCQEREKNMI